jgi:hypothetical protein
MDRIKITREFKRVLWVCPTCGLEEQEDRPMNGGASYVHTCKNGHTFNQSCGAMKEYNGVLSYPYDTYGTVKEEDVEAEKTLRFEKWVYDIKNPVPYVEPKASDIQAEIDSKLQEIQSLEARKIEIEAKTIVEK